MGSKHNDGF